MATKLSRADVLRVAELAHLRLTDAEVETFARQLAGILDWVTAIEQADTTGVEPTAQVSTAPGAWRDDVVSASLDRTAVLDEAPDAAVDAGLFRVPTVL